MARKRDTWGLVEKAITHANKVLLYGPPGTGKTTAGMKVGTPSDVFKVTLHEEMPAAELSGHFVPNGDEFKWHDGVAIKAWKLGARLVLDEIDRGSGDVQTILYAILDDPDVAALTLATGETVYPRHGFTVVATMNGYPDDLPPALRDRFDVTIEVPAAAPAAFDSLSEDIREMAREDVASEAKQKRASIRAWKSFDVLRRDCEMVEAAQMVFGDRAEEIIDSLQAAKI